MAAQKKENTFDSINRVGNQLMSPLIRIVREGLRKAFFAEITPTEDKIAAEYKAWRDRFLWQRLRLWLWIAIILALSFISILIYDTIFPIKEFSELSPQVKANLLTIHVARLLSILACLVLYKTGIPRRYPWLLFLCLSWSMTLVPQVGATLNGFALGETFVWLIVFLSQAGLIPVRWYLHLVSQLGVLFYYVSVNMVLELKQPPPFADKPLYSVGFVLTLFWVCFICDLGVYLYDRLQRSEFYAHKELEGAYQKLRDAEAKYRSIFENAIEGIFQSTPDGRYITANPALARIYGYSLPEEVIANLTDLEHQLYVDSNRRADFVRLIEKYGTVSEFESQVYRQDGSIVWISEKAYAVRDEKGKVLYYEGLIKDITKRKQAEEALQDQLDFLQVLIDTIPAPVFYKNAQGLYLGCNKAFQEFLGLTKEQIIGKSVYDIASKEFADKYHQADMALFEKRGVQTYESSVAYADNTQHDVIFYKATFTKADGNLGGLVGVMLDITERKRTEEALRVFFHAVSHDLRNPVIGTLMVLKNLLNQPEEKITLPRSILERMIQSSDRQLNLINSLMEAHMSELQGVSLQREPMQLHTVVEAAIGDLQPMLAQNQASLKNLIPTDLPLINADPTQLWRVYSNLIANALKHNPPDLCITLNATVDEEMIYCTVSDNGVGMTQEQSQHLFDLYFRGSHSRHSLGLGLGLYLCRRIIEAHGGDIGVKSAPGEGATFWFTLPLGEH